MGKAAERHAQSQEQLQGVPGEHAHWAAQVFARYGSVPAMPPDVQQQYLEVKRAMEPFLAPARRPGPPPGPGRPARRRELHELTPEARMPDAEELDRRRRDRDPCPAAGPRRPATAAAARLDLADGTYLAAVDVPADQRQAAFVKAHALAGSHARAARRRRPGTAFFPDADPGRVHQEFGLEQARQKFAGKEESTANYVGRKMLPGVSTGRGLGWQVRVNRAQAAYQKGEATPGDLDTLAEDEWMRGKDEQYQQQRGVRGRRGRQGGRPSRQSPGRWRSARRSSPSPSSSAGWPGRWWPAGPPPPRPSSAAPPPPG
jgi:hypothetical protein